MRLDRRNLPLRWEICPHCQGEGQSSAHLGSFTQDDIDQDPDWFMDYFAGRFDRACPECAGQGKVHVVDTDRCAPWQLQALAIDEEIAAERRYEQSLRERGIQF